MNECENLELRLILEAVFCYYGYDFRGYDPKFLSERVKSFIEKEHIISISAMQDKVLHDRNSFERFLDYLTHKKIGNLNDTQFFKTFRMNILPHLKDQRHLRIWIAGCSTGEDVFSLSIILHEENLISRCKIYATDINEADLMKAQNSSLPLMSIKKIAANYKASGGKNNFKEYFDGNRQSPEFSDINRKSIIWSRHNLVSDASFNEFQLIICKNVLFYFSKEVQRSVHKLLFESLADNGILALGSNDTISSTPFEINYNVLDSDNNFFKKPLIL